MTPEEAACLSNCELFSKSAEYFEANIVPLWQVLYDTMSGRAGATPGSRVLDVGTGTGEIALRMSRAVGDSGSVLGVDTVEQMLAIAMRKGKAAGSSNLTFEGMSAEKLSLADDSFDLVVGNYSLCCFMDYAAALKECLRVLKPGGRITYSHSGLGDPKEVETTSEIFEKYKTKAPTERLAKIREADLLQNEAVEKYRDPEVALALMRRLGYADSKASQEDRVVRYRDALAYVERELAFDWRDEAAEMSAQEIQSFRKEALAALGGSPGHELVIKDHTVFFTGRKA
ncbi:MAG: class I SAM-dependent methyltransferase [archaeon]|nr:MAG: class I SAM-dependent methyltransferase [archaeon]